MENILVVEDEAITAMDLSNRLTKIGYNVPGIAESGQEAIDLADKFLPDLILMDIMIKGDMDGTMAASKINSTHLIPIVFLTAYNDEQTFNRAKLSNPYAYLSKPVNTRELEIAIELARYKHNLFLKTLQAEKRYHALMTNASCGIIIYSKRGIILEANPEACDILGASNADLINQDIRNFIPEKEVNYLNLKLEKAVFENKIDVNVHHVIQRSGCKRDVEMTSSHIDTGNELLLFSVINDISEQKRLREMAVLNDKLSTIGILTASIIHEINNPLNWISNNLISLKEELQDSISEVHSKLLDESIEGSNKIHTIVSDLKSFGRNDDGNVAPHDIHDIINSVINMAYPQFKNIAAIEKIYATDIPILMLNEAKLSQVLLNILVNAGQSFPPSSNYKNNVIRIFTKLSISRLIIRIEDTGSGMSQEIIDHIFDPFFTTKPAGIGTGLGLSITKDIVCAMNGDITVASTPDVGTIFTISIPLKIAACKVNQAAESIPVTIKHKKILLIDDDSTSLSILKSLFSSDNGVTTAASGRIALDYLINNYNIYDVIISDLNMPDISGMDIHRYLEHINPDLTKKMIFVTGGSYTNNMNQFLTNIKNPCLEKPYTPAQLMEAIQSVTNNIS